MLGKILIMSTILMSSCASAPDNKAKRNYLVSPIYAKFVKDLVGPIEKKINEFETKAKETYNIEIKLSELLRKETKNFNYDYSFQYRTASGSVKHLDLNTCELRYLFNSLDFNDLFGTELNKYRMTLSSIKEGFNDIYQEGFSNVMSKGTDKKNIGDRLKALTEQMVTLYDDIPDFKIFFDHVSGILREAKSNSKKKKLTILNEMSKNLWRSYIEIFLYRHDFEHKNGTDAFNGKQIFEKLGKLPDDLSKKIENVLKERQSGILKLEMK